MTLYHIKKLGRGRHKVFGKYYKLHLIYQLINRLNGRVYIGLTTNLSKRFKSYLYHGSVGDGQMYIHKSIRKNGFKNFDFNIIEICKDSNIEEREKYWIDFYNSNNSDFGYNLTDGGENFKFSEAVIDKMKKSSKNKKRVYLYDVDGSYLREMESINSCGLFLKRKHCSVLQAISNKTIIAKKYLVSFEKSPTITPHINTKSIKLKRKLKNNRNCKTFFWKLTDLRNNKIYVEDGIRKLSLTSGYKQDILRCIAYNRIGYKQYKEFLKIEKLHKYD